MTALHWIAVGISLYLAIGAVVAARTFGGERRVGLGLYAFIALIWPLVLWRGE